MSVKAATTVSIVPASASRRRSSSDSIPVRTPGPPGRITLAMALVRAAGYRRTGCDRRRVSIEFGLVDRAHRAVVAVLGAHPPPDPHDEPDHQDKRRIVERGPVELGVPGRALDVGRTIQRVEDERHKRDRADVDPLVLASKRPRAGREFVALPQAEV